MTWRTRGAIAAAVAFFIGAGMLFVPRLGIEADEALITNGIFDHGSPWYSWKIAGTEIPVMLLSYVGALRAWLYNGLFLLTPPRPVSLRLPMLIVAALTLWLFFALLDQTVGRRAAWIGLALLATDSSYMLLNVVDFGPIALQFFFKLAAILLILRFHRTGSSLSLAWGFFLIGLALWDKAVFLWILFGLSVAVIVVFPRALIARLSIRNALIALTAMAFGALPLLVYNVTSPLDTLRRNASVENGPVLVKADILMQTMSGHVLFGFLTEVEPGPIPGQPRHWFQSLSAGVAQWTGHPRNNLTLAALAASVLALPFLWNTAARRPMLFGLAACIATWVPIALTAGAGVAAQHAVLLWPFQFLVIAAALGSVPLGLAAAGAAILCLSNLAVTNQYYADLIRNGPALRWTDATDALEQYLVDAKPARIFAADWGFFETLNLLGEGNMPLYFADSRIPETQDQMIAAPASLFVSHERGHEYEPEIHAGLQERARLDGYQEVRVTTILDLNGRPTYEVFRFRKGKQ